MLNWPQPRNVTELRGFLGLTGYYRRFVKNYGLLAKPLTRLLQKQQGFAWSEEAQIAFENLKQAMASTPVLALPRFDLPFTVETDASDIGLGAVLMQQGRPIAFISKALGEKNKHLSIYEKEFLALILAVDRWRQYLQRGAFVIKTDHKSLTYLGDQQLQSDLQKKAMTKLMGLQFQVVYKKGTENVVADALSRVEHMMGLSVLSEIQPIWIQEVVNSYATDEDAQQLITQLLIQSPDEQGFSLQQGIIRKANRIWIGCNSALRTKLIAALHDSAVGGHSGIQATYQRVKKVFWWKGLKNDVTQYVQQCAICQKAKAERVHPAGLLQPLPVPQGIWEDVTMDFIEGLPKSEGFDTILVVVDRFSKYSHFLPLKHPFTAKGVAQVFLENVVKLHGVPRSIVSDRDKVFTSAFWKNLFQLMGVKLLMSTAYHPQTDGQSERVNQCLEMYLRCAVHDQPNKWKSWLALAEYWYNTTHHSVLGCTPFKVLYGYEAPLLVAPKTLGMEDREIADWFAERNAFSVMLKEQLARAQLRMKQYADKGRTPREFQVGDLVLLKLQPYAQKTVVNRSCPKLAFKYFGPFKVISRIGEVAYKLELPGNAQVHPVFHVSQLKPFLPCYSPVFSELPPAVDLSQGGIEPEQVLDRRMVRKGNRAIVQVLVKWSGVPKEAATWEDYAVVRARFPEANAWGQALSEARGDVMTEDAD
jgi:hypothetical protein